MSDRRWTPNADPDRPFRLELRRTRDLQVPLVVDDPGFRYGFRCHPLAPGPELDWFIFDDTAQYHTEWARRAVDHIAEAKLSGGTAKLLARGWLRP